MKISPTKTLRKAAKEKKKSTPKPFPIVGFGASAGGLEAFTAVLKNLDNNLGMAYVLVMHLSPNHKSALADILSTKTKMPVHTVKDRMAVKPNNVYVIPPNAFMSLVDGHLKLAPRSFTRIGNFAIDYFLDALASIYKNNAIGIILSGTATDGTLGLKAIKANGGITFAQDGSAKFSGMPRSAYDSGYADFLLSPQAIAKELAILTKLPYTGLAANKFEKGQLKLLKENPEDLKNILRLVREKHGVDFFLQYKQASIYRRVVRRMTLNKFNNLEEYLKMLQADTKEIDALYNDFLINVTKFFRDSEFFRTLEEKIIPSIVKQRKPSDPLRVWIAGCATGEEAYSVAISLLEFSKKNDLGVPITIFGSDLDAKAIEKARIGIYPLIGVHGVPEPYLKKYFRKIDGHYQIEKSVREICIFSQQNLLKDPPFSRMDFISCQNVLIYLEAEPQKRILETFHYALKPTGFLFLGKSETIGSAIDLFDSLDKKARIFRKKSTGTPTLEFTTHLSGPTQPQGHHRPQRQTISVEQDMGKLLLTTYVPPSIVLNKEFNIVQFFGLTAPYLGPVIGKASFNILKMIREDLLIDLRSLLQLSRSTGKTARKENLRITTKKTTQELSIEVVPKKINTELFYLVVFIENNSVAAGKQPKKKTRDSAGAKEKTIIRLEDELLQARDLIKNTNEEYETTYEELQANNEEISSSNEELQSVNEELETSKEELQSANEELTTINDELHKRNFELKESHTYADAIIQTIHNPLLILTSNLQVRMANTAFYKTFKLSKEETESSFIYDLGSNSWEIPTLRNELNDLLNKKVAFKEFEIINDFPTLGELVLDVHAYSLLKNDIFSETLILLAFNNVSELTKSNRKLMKANEQLEQYAFISGHDLQEPLRKIQTYANFLSTQPAELNEFSHRYVDKINASAARMSGLIKDLLRYTHFIGTDKTNPEAVNLNDVLRDIINDFELTIEDSKASVTVSKLPTVPGERMQLNQLFYNLIGNALKFAKEKPVINVFSKKLTRTEINSFPELKKERNYVRIVVEDKGIGFDQRYADKMFILFQRLQDKKDAGGTGIGLTICKKIVELHDGIIMAKGVENEGATFTIVLPV